jgi:hypothetical protein|uniref:Uncharacterized protein n=1 Tax=viral metagenome TaxID=1070528 RepID=A0A6C0CDG3_9ZZZZ
MVKPLTKKINTTNPGTKYERLKKNIIKYGSLVILFVLIFDKLTIFVIMYLFVFFKRLCFKHKEPFTKLDYSNFDTSYNNFSYNPLYSQVFKNTGLNLKSYNNVAIDPRKPLLENNKFLPECCLYNSEYSTSKGCACITPTQQEYLRRRGTNKSASSFIQDNSSYNNLFFSPTLAIKGDPIPFNKNDTRYIVDFADLTSAKINEFANLTNKLDSELIDYNPSTQVTI